MSGSPKYKTDNNQPAIDWQKEAAQAFRLPASPGRSAIPKELSLSGRPIGETREQLEERLKQMAKAAVLAQA